MDFKEVRKQPRTKKIEALVQSLREAPIRTSSRSNSGKHKNRRSSIRNSSQGSVHKQPIPVAQDVASPSLPTRVVVDEGVSLEQHEF